MRVINNYDAQLVYTDRQMARLYRGFNELRGDESTLWVVTADHGEGLGDHDYVGHGRYLYREQLRVPLIVHSVPARWTPARIVGMVRLVDLYQTIMELVGFAEFETLQKMEGSSLVPLFTDPDHELPIDYLFAQRRPVCGGICCSITLEI